MVLDKLSSVLTKVANELGYSDELNVIKSNRLDLCDYQCDSIFKLSKKYHKSPMEIGNEIVNCVNNIDDFPNYFDKVEFCMPGFINITVSNKFINDTLIEMELNDGFNFKINDKKTYVIDYGGPNVAKPLHVGHLRPAIIGESIKRILKFVGNDVISDVHLGDIGLPIGEVIYAALNDNLKPDDLTLEYLNEVYPKMSSIVKEDAAIKNECANLIKQVQDKEAYLDYWEVIRELSINDIKRLYKYLDISFDYWLSESDAYEYIPLVEKMLKDKKLLVESDGAQVVFIKTDEDNKPCPPLIFRKSNGAYLYESSDLGTIYQRMNDFNPDCILYVTDARQAFHFEQVFRVCKLSGMTKDTLLYHLPHGTINGLDGKPYKTRSGNTPKLDELFKEVEDIFKSKKELNKSMSDEDIKKQVNAIIKFGDLQNSRDKDYIFDINKFSDTTGKTGPYVLYTYLRMNKIVNKYDTNIKTITNRIYNKYDRDLRMSILDYELYINNALKEFKPNFIAEYIYNVCNCLNSFYQNNHIANLTDNDKLNDWVSVIKLANRIIKEMLNLLIIDIPTEM